MAKPNVPKFGNWESEDNVPYTVYFNNARKNKVGGKMINPNDPSQNPEMFAHLASPPPPPPPKPRTRQEEAQRFNREDGEVRHLGTTSSANHGGGRGQGQRSAKHSLGSEHSFERSPLHPQYQKNVMGRSNGSTPLWEGKSNDSSHARSRLRPADHGDQTGAAVPRFGEWNENDPQSAENFTHIFNKVREERNNVAGGNTPKHPSYTPRNLPSNSPKKCCFPWW